jgi:hypothetical protein
MLSLRDNRLKSSTSNKRNQVEFFDETYENKKELNMYNLEKLLKFRPPVQCSDNPIKSKEFRSYLIGLRFLFIISQSKRF